MICLLLRQLNGNVESGLRLGSNNLVLIHLGILRLISFESWDDYLQNEIDFAVFDAIEFVLWNGKVAE